MRIGIALAVATVLLAACGSEAGSARISPEVLNDPSALQRIGDRLPPAERELFGHYVASRSMVVGLGAKPLVNSEGKDPETVAEAVALQRWVEQLSAEKEAAQVGPKAVLDRGMDGTPVQEYNAAVAAYNAAIAEFNAKRDRGPPPGLGKS